MKYKYLKVNGELIWGEHDLTKEMLVMAKNGQYDTIINLDTMQTFNASENRWEDIKGNAQLS